MTHEEAKRKNRNLWYVEFRKEVPLPYGTWRKSYPKPIRTVEVQFRNEDQAKRWAFAQGRTIEGCTSIQLQNWERKTTYLAL